VKSLGADVPPRDVPPHVGRLLARLGELPSPVIQVWGWPGTGKRALLEALLDREGRPDPDGEELGGARALARAEVDREERLQATLERPEVVAARWLVGLDLPPEAVVTACRLLRPGQRLVSAGSLRLDDAELPVSFLTPAELLLTRDEGIALWRAVVEDLAASSDRGERAGPEASGAEIGELLWELTSGWYTPMRLAGRAIAEGSLDPPSAADDPAVDEALAGLLELPPLRAFLRHEVFEPLPSEVRDALVARARSETAQGETAPSEAPEDPESARVLARYGWAPEAAGGPPSPKILEAFLREQHAPTGSPQIGTEKREDRKPEASPEVRIALLGAPRVTLLPEAETAEEVEIHWPLKRALKILAYLASSKDFQAPRDDLVAALWPEDDEERIARNFHPTLSHLRRAFHEAWEEVRGAPARTPLVFVHDTYRLNPEIVWEVDVVELSSAGERGRGVVGEDPEAAVRIWRQAVDRVRGPFLAGIYDAWTEPLRERYQRRWLDLLRELADLYLRLDRFTEAVDAYRRVLIEDPLREPVHQALMRVYARQGRRDLVRRQYDRLSNLLAEELGVEPLPRTTEEYHRLMG
jgi:DNA-binding SARP family transcriptional activator